MPCLALIPSIEVLLVDDQRAILAGVTALLESESPTMRVVGSAMTGRQALERAYAVQPDVIVLDVNLGGEDGLTLIPQLRACCNAAIIVLSDITTEDTPLRALHLGANGCVSKSATGDALIAAIRHAASSVVEIQTHMT